jgi:hypothetical protein
MSLRLFGNFAAEGDWESIRDLRGRTIAGAELRKLRRFALGLPAERGREVGTRDAMKPIADSLREGP